MDGARSAAVPQLRYELHEPALIFRVIDPGCSGESKGMPAGVYRCNQAEAA